MILGKTVGEQKFIKQQTVLFAASKTFPAILEMATRGKWRSAQSGGGTLRGHLGSSCLRLVWSLQSK